MVGSELGHYKILSALGAGGMGEISTNKGGDSFASRTE
jgi:hypothetical protein